MTSPKHLDLSQLFFSYVSDELSDARIHRGWFGTRGTEPDCAEWANPCGTGGTGGAGS